MENNNETNFSGETKMLMRSSAGWIRTYAILMLIFLSILVIAILVLSGTSNSRIVAEAFSDAPRNVAEAFSGIFGLVLFTCAVFIALFGYAVIKLLAAGNNFTSISYTGKKTDVISVFKNMKLFWMFHCISMITLILFVIFIVIKFFLIAQSA